MTNPKKLLQKQTGEILHKQSLLNFLSQEDTLEAVKYWQIIC